MGRLFSIRHSKEHIDALELLDTTSFEMLSPQAKKEIRPDSEVPDVSWGAS